MQTLVVIEGPTASGKTALGVKLAKHLKTVVISADSRQFYKEVSIGTAKPAAEEMDGIKHYFIDSHALTDPVSASRFENEAMELLQSELKDLPIVIVVGGSGMFIDALCIGLDPIPVDEGIQDQLRAELETRGLSVLLEELKSADLEFYKVVDQSNPTRILRALEVIRITGKPYSSFRNQQPPPRPFRTIRFVLDWPREVLYSRINHRVDMMMEADLLSEVESVVHLRHLPSLQTVGYRELFAYLDGEINLERAVEKIKQHTRNYAKRQLTWFKRHEDAHWLQPSSDKDLMPEVLEILQNQHNYFLE